MRTRSTKTPRRPANGLRRRCGNADLPALRPRQLREGVARQAHRAGVYKCKGCEQQFTVTVGTLFERCHIPLNKWLLAIHLMTATRRASSAHQLHRMLGLTYKSAWFMCIRIREAMREASCLRPLGGQNKVVEADETYIGGKEANKHKAKASRPARRQGQGSRSLRWWNVTGGCVLSTCRT